MADVTDAGHVTGFRIGFAFPESLVCLSERARQQLTSPREETHGRETVQTRGDVMTPQPRQDIIGWRKLATGPLHMAP